MSGIWIVASILSFACVAVLYWNMMRRDLDEGLSANASSLAIYKDQLAEVDRDVERGILSDEQAEPARNEIKRRILSLADADTATGRNTYEFKTMIVAALIVPVAAFGLYAKLGQPNLPSLPYAERGEEVKQQRDITALTAKLRARLESDVDGGASDGWMLLGQTYMRQNKYSDAAYAYGKVAARSDADTVVLSRYGEALVASENGTVTPQAMAIFDRALSLQPLNPAPVYYKALGLEQAGDVQAAHDLLTGRLAESDQLEPWMPSFAELANRFGGSLGLPPLDLDNKARPRGPSAQDVEDAQQMSAEDQKAFIESMVAGLASRLEENPDDLNGWLRLAQAYTVLGQADQARAAYLSAQKLTETIPADDPRRAVITNGLAQ